MRKIYWYVTIFLRKHGWQVLISVAVALAFFLLLLPYVINNLSQTRRYYIGLVGEYRLDNLPDLITKQISHGLTTTEVDGDFDLDLATSLSIEEDGTIYRFTIPDDLVWQDGKALVASDIDYQLTGATTSYSSNEVIYTLDTPFAAFPQFATTPLLRLETVPYLRFWQRQKLIGIGDFEISDYRYRNQSIYSNLAEVTVDNKATGERYIYRFYLTPEQATLAFKKGDIDTLIDIADPGEIKDWQNVMTSERTLENQYLAIFFNTNDPLLTTDVRQALSYATDKSWPGTERATGPIVNSSWAYFEGSKKYDKNLDQAVERLLNDIPMEPLNLEMTTLASFYDVAERTKSEWQELGEKAYEACRNKDEIEDKAVCENLHIEVSINIQMLPDTHNYQVLLIGQEVTPDPDQYSLWHSDVPTNFTHYKDTKADSLLETGRQTIVQDERRTIYQEFQQVFLEDPPAIFLWYLKTYDLTRK